MFNTTPNLEELRQGDIVQGLYYPLMKCSDLRIIGTITNPYEPHRENLTLTSVPGGNKYGRNLFLANIEVFGGYSVIISQCCDLELHNGRLDNPAFVAAPLIDIPALIQRDKEKLLRFQENQLESFVNLFHIQQQAPLLQAYAVDFSRLVSIVNSDYQFALAGKILQMTGRNRVRFKIKLGRHFGRPTQEEISNGLYPYE
ncbi:MAG: hypothetical protein ACR2G4_09965 [Pyrinomonadaceae bacterium]